MIHDFITEISDEHTEYCQDLFGMQAVLLKRLEYLERTTICEIALSFGKTKGSRKDLETLLSRYRIMARKRQLNITAFSLDTIKKLTNHLTEGNYLFAFSILTDGCSETMEGDIAVREVQKQLTKEKQKADLLTFFEEIIEYESAQDDTRMYTIARTKPLNLSSLEFPRVEYK